MRALVLAVLILCPTIGWGQTISSYNGTVFVPGLQEKPEIWSRLHTNGVRSWLSLDAAIDLRGAHFPAVPTDSSLLRQRTSLRSYLDAVNGGTGSKVLVAHSMGGVAARETYRLNQAGIAGIVTIATPHTGTFVANNAWRFEPYLQTTITRLSQAGIPMGFVAGVLTPVGPILGVITGAIFGQYVRQYRDTVERNFSLPQGAIDDLKIGSTAMGTLAAYSGDGALPRASIQGSIPVRNFPIRLYASLTDPGQFTYSQMVRSRNVLLSGLKTCRVALYVTIVLSPVGRKCSLAKKMLARMDHKWFAWSTGQPYGHTSPRVFDGIVEESRGRYPHLADAARKRIANGSDHHSILFDGPGVFETAQAMQLIGMASR